MNRTPPRTTLLLVATTLCVALLLRCAAAVWWQARLPADQNFGMPDSESYWALARAVAAGGPYQFGGPDAKVFRAPGYPLLLAPLFWAFGDAPPVGTARLLGAVLGTLTVGGVGWLAWLVVGGGEPARRSRALRTACWAMALAAFYPGAIMMSVLVLSEALFCPLMVLQLGMLVRQLGPCSPRKALLLAGANGMIAAAAVLVRPSWLLFPPCWGVALLLFAGDRWARFQQLMVLGGCMAACMAPWWLRNYWATGVLVPTTLQVGASLYDGLSPTATGASDMRFVETFRERLRRQDAEASQLPALPFEVRLDRTLRDAAIDWARRHPQQVVRLAWVKLQRIWNPFPNHAPLNSGLTRWVTALSMLAVSVPAIVGLVLLRRSPAAWTCAAPAAYFTALHMVFAASIRYRQPALLAATVLAAVAVAWVWELARRGRR